MKHYYVTEIALMGESEGKTQNETDQAWAEYIKEVMKVISQIETPNVSLEDMGHSPPRAVQ